MKKQIFNGLTSLILPLGAYAGIAPAGSYQPTARSYLRTEPSSGMTQDASRYVVGADNLSTVAEQNNELMLVQRQAVRELVIVDSAVPDKQIFFREAKPGVEIVEIDSAKAGLTQLIDALAKHKNLAALHIVSHAEDGVLLLGNSRITAENIKYEIEAFAALNGALREGGDLLLYGCDLAKSEAGTELLDIVQRNTHLDLAASSNLTGSSIDDGDWSLEIQRGEIESGLPFSVKATADFSHVLATTHTLASFGFKYGGDGADSGCASDSPGSESWSYYALTKDSYIGCGFLGIDNGVGNGFGGTTVDLRHYHGGSYSPAYLVSDKDGYAGTSLIEIRTTGTSFRLTGVELTEFPPNPAFNNGYAFSNVKIIGYPSDGDPIETDPLPVGDDMATTTDFSFGSAELANLAGHNLTRFRVSFYNEAGSLASGMQLVSFTTAPPNTAPTLTTITPLTGATEDTAFTISYANLAAAADEADGDDDPLSFRVEAVSTGTLTKGGTAVTAGDTLLSSGEELVWTPAVDANGPLNAFTVRAWDGTTTSSSDVQVQVNVTAVEDAPEVSGLPSDVTVTEDTASNFDLSAATFADGDGDSLTVTLAAAAGTLTASSGGGVTVTGSGTGTLSLAGTPANLNTFLDTTSNIQYTGAADASGDNATTVTINADDGTTNPLLGTVNIDITATNDAPTAIGIPTDISVIENTASDFDLSTLTFTDIDGDSLTVTLTAGTGTLAATSGGGVTVGGSGTGTLTLSATVANLNTYLDTASNVQYTGPASTVGNDVTTVSVNANDGTVNPLLGTINVDITAANNTPAIGNLDGDSIAWAGVGNTVALDSGGDATASDTELDALNGANGDYSGGSLTVQRSGGAVTSDTLGFDISGALFTVNGSDLQDGGGQTFATFTNTNGVLTISFTNSGTTPTTALVSDVMQRITYRNDTPAGDATVRFTLSDGTATDTADVTVTSDSVYITETTDTATIDPTDGTSFSEAIAIAAADGTGTQTLILDSGLAAQTLSTASATSLTESLTLDMDAASGVTLSGGTLSLGGGVTLMLNNGSSDTASISTVFAGTGSLAKAGDGTVTLTGTQTYSGTTTFTGGTISVAGDSNLGGGQLVFNGGTLSATGSGTIDNAINIAANSIFNHDDDTTLSGLFSGAADLSLTGSGELQLSNTGNEASSSATLTLVSGSVWLNSDDVLPSGVITLNGGTLSSNGLSGASTTIDNNLVLGASGGTFDIFGDNYTLELSGVISGTGNLLKTSAARLSLTGTNTYTGTTTIQNGQVVVAGDSNLGSGSLIFNGGTLTVTGSGVTIDNGVTMTGNGTVSNANNITLSGVISSTGTLVKTGAGTLTLSATQTHSGATTVSAGSVSIASDSNIGSGTLTLDGGTLTVTGSSTIDNAISLGAGHGTVSNADSVALSGVISGSGNLTKTGAGALILSGTNTYTGLTSISAGSVNVAGTLAGPLSAATGTVLESTGAISGLVTINNGATLQTGSSPGTLTLGNGLTVDSGGTLVARVNGTTAGSEYDQYDVTGPVTLGGTLSLTGTHTPAGGDSFVIINNDASDAVNNTFDGLAEGSTVAFGGVPLTVGYAGNTGNDVTLGVIPPAVTDNNISISGGTGAGGAYTIGDTVTVTWDDTPATGDNNGDIAAVTADFTAFGGGATVAATNNSGTWTATYEIVAGGIDGTNLNVSVTATDNDGISSTQADSTNATVDNIAPTVNDANISISGATGTDGAYIVGDTVTVTWNNTASGDNNTDTISNATADFSAFGGGAAVSASNSSGTWTATYTLTSGAVDGTNLNAAVTVTDNAGNTATASDTTNATVDNVPPTVTDNHLSLSGASGIGGAFIAGDTVTATWNDTAGGDNNSDTIAGVTFDFSEFGGAAAVAASNSSGTWTATYDLLAGALESSNLNVAATVTDNAGNVTTTADTSNATVDTQVPEVSSVSVPANATYVAGQNLDFTVNTSQDVTVVTTGGTPRLALTLGSTTVYATYISGSGTSALTFRYTVQTGDADSDGISVDGLQTNSGTLQDASGNNLTLALNGLGSTAAVLVDAVAPTVSSVSVPGSATYVEADTLSFTVNTSENVTVDTGGGTPRLALDIGGTTRYATYVSGSGSSALVFGYTVQTGDLDTDGIAVSGLQLNSGTLRDGAGNDLDLSLNTVGDTSGVLVDAQAPTLTTLDPVDDAPAVLPDANLVMTFSEDVALGTGNISVYDADDVLFTAVDVENPAGQLNVTGNTLTLDLSGDLLESQSYYVLIDNGAISDLADNPYAGIGDPTVWNFAVADISPPEVTVITLAGTPGAADASVDYTVVFDETANNVSVDDFTLTTTGTAVGTIDSVSAATGSLITVTVNAISGTGSVRLDVNANTDIVDDEGNGNSTNGYVAAFTAGDVHDVDHDAPDAPLALDLDAASDSGESVEDDITNDTTPTLSGTAEADATIALTSSEDGAIGTATADGSGDWTVTTNALSEGAHDITATATDAAGNTSDASAALTVTLDTTLPSVTGSAANSAAANDASVVFDVSFDETVYGLATDDFVLTSTGTAAGSIAGVSVTEGSSVAVTVNAIGGTGSLRLDTTGAGITDIAGNTAAAFTGGTAHGVDRNAATVSDANIAITGATGTGGSFKVGDTVTATWDNTASGDNNPDVATVSADFSEFGGSAQAATNTAGVWTAAYTLTVDALDAAARNVVFTVVDTAGNTAITADSTNATVDRQPPVVSDSHISLSGATGTGGVFKAGDTVTAVWDNTGDGDSNLDIAGVTMNFSAFGGNAAEPASNSAGLWSASYTLANGLDDDALNVSVTATDDAGNSTTGTDTSNASIDTTIPTGHSVSFDDSLYNASEAGAVSFTFAAAEIGASYSYSIASSGGGTAVTGTGTVASATEQVSSVDVSGLSDGTLTLSVTLTDPAGNSASAITDTATLDASAPSGQSVTFDDATLNAAEAGAMGVTFAGAEVGATYNYSITSSGGGTAVSGSGTFASATEQLTGVDVSGLNDGTLTLSVVTTDTAGNEAPAITANAALDQTSPTAAIASAVADPANSAFTATVTFSETVSGFAVGDITAGNASLSDFTDNGGGSYSVTVTPTADGSVTLDVAAGVAQDAVGNDNTAASAFSVAYDGTAPPPAITTAASSPTNAAFVADIDFGETVSGFVLADISAGNATLSDLTDNGGGSYSVTVTPTADGTVTLDVAAGVAQDAAGNDNLAAAQLSLVYDTAVPEAVITSSESDPTNNSSFAVGIAFGESVSGFVVGDIAATNATLNGFTDNGSGNYSVTVTPTADGTVSLTIPAGAAQDAAANDNLAANFSVVYDGTAPTLAASNPADNATNVPFDTDVVLTFSEAIEAGTGNLTVFDASDDSVVEAFAIADVTITTNTLTVALTDTLTPTESYYVQVDGAALQDAAGNLYAGIGDNTTLNFTVTNVAPTAANDAATVNEDQSVDILVLANDQDPDSAFNNASVQVVTTPTSGTTSVDTGSGAITYTPAAHFNGTDTFTYTVEDVYSGVSNQATVTVTVNPVNDAPVAVADSVSTPEDNAISIDVAANDTDRDAGDSVDPATIAIVSGAANGTVSVVNGEVLYEPELDFNGSDSFTYTIDDQNGATSNVVTVLINVTGINDLPDVLDDTASVDEDDAVNIDVLANDSDVDGTLEASSVSILSQSDHGTTEVDALTGVVTYTPDANYHGSDSFVYSVEDDAGGSATGTVTVTVNSINDAPTANADSATLLEDNAHTINVLGNDLDIDGNLVPASVEVVTAAEEGTTTVNATSGAIVYTPAENFNGDDTFTYRVQDNDGDWSNTVTVTISVNDVNDLPLANSDSATTEEDTPVTINLLSNDSDVDGTLDSTAITLTEPANGSVTDNGDGTVTYSPNENVFGSDSFTYTVADDDGGVSNSATVSITVDPVNDAPVISGTPAGSVNEDSPYSFVPEASDVDPNTTLTFSIDNQPGWASFDTDTGALTGTPENEHVGEYTGIVVSVSDGVTSTALPAFAITVINVNDAPVLEGTPVATINQDGSYNFAPQTTDVDAGDELTFSVTNLPAWASFDPATGAITGTPGNSDVGTYHDVTISVSDGTTTTAFDSFDITVENVNDPPTIAGDSYTLAEGATLQPAAATGVLANDVDIDGDTLQAELVSNPRNATAFTLNADGSFAYQHNGGETRTDSFTYRITDGEYVSDPATVSVAVTPVNDPPSFVTEPELVVLEGQTYSYDVGVTDPDSVSELSLVDGPDWLSLSGGHLSGTAPLNEIGTVAVVLRASDEEYTVDQSFDLVVQEQEASVVTISTSWSGLPSIVDNTVDLQVTLNHSKGPAVPDATLRVTLAGLDTTATMTDCTGSVANGFSCASGLNAGDSRRFRLRLTPQEAGNLVVNLSLNEAGEPVAAAITDVSVAPQATSQGDVKFNIANATALASINLLNDGTRELVAGTALGDTVKLLDYSLSATSASVLSEIENRGYTERVRVVDVDLDGLEDIVVVNRNGDASAIYYDRGGEFEPESGSLTLPHAREAILRDLNDDGFPELILGASGFNVYIYESNEGVFDIAPLVFESPASIVHFALLRRLPANAPMSGTLVISSRNVVQLVRFGLNPDGGVISKPDDGSEQPSAPVSQKFTVLRELPLSGVSSLQLVDVNGDGREEIIASTTHQNNSAENSGVAVIAVDDNDQMQTVARLGAASANHVDVADFNGDSIPDLLVANDNNSYQFYRGTGDATDWNLTNTILYHSSTLVLPEDVNDDGLADVLVYEDNDEQVQLYLSAPDGELGAEADLVLEAQAETVRKDRVHFDYTLTVSNAVAGDVDNVRITLPLPSTIGVVQLPDACTQDTDIDEVHCQLDVLNSGEAWTVTMTLEGGLNINQVSLNPSVTSEALEVGESNNSTSTPLTGMFEQRRARVKGGGSLDWTWLALLVGLATVVCTRGRLSQKPPQAKPRKTQKSRGRHAASVLLVLGTATLLSAALAPPSVQAQSAERVFYGEFSVKAVSGDWDAPEFFWDSLNSTQSHVIREKKSGRFGWQLLLGHEIHRHVSVEAGYLDAGQTELEMDVFYSDGEAVRNLLTEHAPISGEGPYLGVRLTTAGHGEEQFFAKLGFWNWSADYTLTLGDESSRFKVEDTDWVLGAGFTVPMNDRLNLGGSLQSVGLDDERLLLFGVDAVYRF